MALNPLKVANVFLKRIVKCSRAGKHYSKSLEISLSPTCSLVVVSYTRMVFSGGRVAYLSVLVTWPLPQFLLMISGFYFSSQTNNSYIPHSVGHSPPWRVCFSLHPSPAYITQLCQPLRVEERLLLSLWKAQALVLVIWLSGPTPNPPSFFSPRLLPSLYHQPSTSQGLGLKGNSYSSVYFMQLSVGPPPELFLQDSSKASCRPFAWRGLKLLLLSMSKERPIANLAPSLIIPLLR